MSNHTHSSLDEKRTLLERLLREEAAREKTLYPLCSGQQALWFLYQGAPESATYNVAAVVRILSPVDVSALRTAFQTLLARHPSLRATFSQQDDQPTQTIHGYRDVYFEEFDASTDTEEELHRRVTEIYRRPFDLEQDLMLRVGLFTRAAEDHVLLITIHHIVSDAWSMWQLMSEFFALYPLPEAEQATALAPLRWQYQDFVRWQAEMLEGPEGERLWQYWREQLEGELPVLDLPTDRPRPPVLSNNGASIFFTLPATLTRKLKSQAQTAGVTFYTILLAAFQVLLHRYTGQDDILVGSPVAGRGRPEFKNIFGCFFNYMVLRADVGGDPTFSDLLGQVRQTVLAGLAHQDYPFPLLLERLQPTRHASRSPIFQVTFALQRSQQEDELPALFLGTNDENRTLNKGGLTLAPFRMAQSEGHQFDLILDILETRQSLSGADTIAYMRYNADLFEAGTIADMLENFRGLLEAIADNPAQRISALLLPKRIPRRETGSIVSDKSTEHHSVPTERIAITATFTAEPIKDALDFWIRELQLPFAVAFAPYNQVFQQLLDPGSLIARNRSGINVLLVRLQDWGKPGMGAVDTNEIERNVRHFVEILQAASGTYIVCICPPPPEAAHGAFYRQTEEWLIGELDGAGNLHCLGMEALMSVYPVPRFADLHTDVIGHIPYTPTFFTALGTGIARRIHALSHPPHKVIVLDCDNTLWRGVCAEDGTTGVHIDEPHLALQRFMIAQQEAGKLLCLCSKNREEDVLTVFDGRPDMLLQRGHLVSWRIDWQSKSENIRALANELNLGLSSFIFVDDNPVECAEVHAYCPEVVTVELPADPERWEKFLDHVWAFDTLQTTAEDRQRTQYYQQDRRRDAWRQDAPTFSDFLADLQLEIEISPMTVAQSERVAQLTQRTNQFNFTTIRRSETEIRELFDPGPLECLAVEVKDRFGDYGLVGVMLFERTATAIHVDTFLLSCRALGRGVEHRMLARLGEIAREHGCDIIRVSYVPSEKNRPALAFLESIGDRFKRSADQGWEFYLPAESISGLTYAPAEPAPASSGDARTAPDKGDGTGEPADSALFQRIATELYDADEILVRIRERGKKAEISQEAYVAPRTREEQLLAGIWADVLGLDRVGINDNFFQLGGHSLLGTQVMSRIRDTFAVGLSLHVLFQSQTIAELSTRLYDASARESSLPRITPVERTAPLPLSFAQQRLWFLDRFETGGTATYNIPAALQFEGPLDVDALQFSLQWMVERHESLRMAFPDREGAARVEILPASGFEFPIHDLRHLSPAERNLQQRIDEHAARPFDLARGPLFRVEILQLGEETGKAVHVLLFNMHHIVSDGWSAEVFVREWREAYVAFARGKPPGLAPLPIQYTDYAYWQRQWLEGEILEGQLAWWKGNLAGIPDLLDLHTDHPRPARQDYRGNHYGQVLGADVTAALNTLSREQGVTLFMTLLAAFDVLLSRYSGQDDICVGSPIANRTHAQLENLIGFFVNTLVLRARLNPDQSFRALLQQVRQTCLGAYAHQDIPFETLVEQLNPARALSHSPLFQVVLDLQNNAPLEMEWPGLTLTILEHASPIAKFDLVLFIEEQDGQLHCTWEYATSLFTIDTIRRMGEHFEALLRGIVAEPETPISRLPLLTETERQRIVVEWNDTEGQISPALLHDLFIREAQRRPDAPAIIAPGRTLTYGELLDLAKRTAHWLQRNNVAPNTLVAVVMEKGWEQVVAVLGILMAGGAYLPIDAHLPAARRKDLLIDGEARLALTQPQFTDMEWPDGIKRLIVSEQDLAREEASVAETTTGPEDLAYVIYTSGSTGKPKGVVIDHRGAVNTILDVNRRFSVTEEDRVLCLSALNFDLSVYDVFGVLAAGGVLVIPEEAGLRDPAHWRELMLEHGITLWDTVPALKQMLVEYLESRAEPVPSGMRLVMMSGDWIPLDLPGRIRALWPEITIIGLGGATEASIWSNFYPIEDVDPDWKSIPYGKPLTNQFFRVLDSNLEPCPVRIPGDLYIGGIGLAKGYWNDPAKTAERFITHPATGERLYRTGDLGRYLPDGNLEFLGRSDFQVKIRGYRIELGEIEAVLTSHPGVKEAVVTAVGEERNLQALTAYVVPLEEGQPTDGIAEELKAHVGAGLPGYMVPATFTVLDALPLTSSGKIDRKALPAPDASERDAKTEFAPPNTEREKRLAEIWGEVLDRKNIDIHDNFFEAGGDSFLVVRLQSRLRDAFDKEIPIAELFEHSTIHTQAEYLDWVPVNQITQSELDQLDDAEVEALFSSYLDEVNCDGQFEWNSDG